MHINVYGVLRVNFVKFSMSITEFPFIVEDIEDLNPIYKKYLKLVYEELYKK